MKPPPSLALELPDASPTQLSPQSIINPPVMLYYVPEKVDRVVGTLYRWMIEGAQNEHSYAGNMDIAGETEFDLVEKCVEDT